MKTTTPKFAKQQMPIYINRSKSTQIKSMMHVFDEEISPRNRQYKKDMESAMKNAKEYGRIK